MGESITGGVLSAWRVKDGDTVERDQVLFELETDKITSEGMAEAPGRIAIKVAEGEDVTVGQVVAEIDEEAAAKTEEAPAGRPEAEVQTNAAASRVPATPEGVGDRLSPAVRRLAEETGVDPETVQGSGKAGRVTKADMLAAAEQHKGAPRPAQKEAPPAAPAPAGAPAPAPPAAASAEGRTSRRKLSPLRQRIGQRLVSAQQEAAILSTFNEVDMSAVRDLRARYQEKFVEKHGIKLGFMSFFIKAVVYGLKEVPAINAQLEGDTLIQNHFYDIGVAVSSEKGLLVPVIKNCDGLSLAGLEKELAGYAKKAREGKIQIADLEGGVFTISNGGIFGSLLSTPIINPPQSGILGMHAIQERPVAVNGQVEIRPMMYLALSYDHRLVDGREAVTFLVKVKQAIEDPSRLLLEI